MSFTMVPLLMHSDAVPAVARDALKAAYSAPPERRDAELLSAVRVLYRETDLDCGEAKDLVGLTSCATCG
jgi:hypothetical protein